jgi:hypothetical protein
MDFVIVFDVSKIFSIRVQKTSAAPKQMDYRIFKDPESTIGLKNIGTDASGQRTELTPSAGRPTGRPGEETYTQRWTGRVRKLDPQTRRPEWTGKPSDVKYPVKIDPTVSVNVTASSEDGVIASFGYSAALTKISVTNIGAYYWYTIFDGVTIPQGSTINSAVVSHAAFNSTSATYQAFCRWAKLAPASGPADLSFSPATGWTGATTPLSGDPVISGYSGGQADVIVKPYVQAMVNANGFSNQKMMFEFSLVPQTSPASAGYFSFGSGAALAIDYTEPPPADKTVIYFD